jgi:hypothetical protein
MFLVIFIAALGMLHIRYGPYYTDFKERFSGRFTASSRSSVRATPDFGPLLLSYLVGPQVDETPLSLGAFFPTATPETEGLQAAADYNTVEQEGKNTVSMVTDFGNSSSTWPITDSARDYDLGSLLNKAAGKDPRKALGYPAFESEYGILFPLPGDRDFSRPFSEYALFISNTSAQRIFRISCICGRDTDSFQR